MIVGGGGGYFVPSLVIELRKCGFVTDIECVEYIFQGLVAFGFVVV